MNHKLKFLVIEDSKTIRDIVHKVVAGICGESQVWEAADGKEGFRIMSSQKIDCIISDLNIEDGMSGDNFLRRIRASSIFKNKKIFVFSSDTDNPILNELDDIEFIDKADGVQKLIGALENYMEKNP